MGKLSLPLKDFKFMEQQWDSEVEPQFIRKVLETTDDSDVGHLVQVDLSYLDAFHDLHSDFSRAPAKQQVEQF